MAIPSGYTIKSTCCECGAEQNENNSPIKQVDGEKFYSVRCRPCSNARLKKWREDNYEKWAELNRNNAKRVRTKNRSIVIKHYGGKCECCGEKTKEFMTIDHINGGGNKHRKSLSKKGFEGSSFYWWLIKNDFPEGYRVLCWNCNASHGMYGYCPHHPKSKD